MDTNNNQHLEIDILFLLKKLWTRKFLISFFAALVGAISLAYTLFLVTPLYSSTTRIYVVNQNANSNTITLGVKIAVYEQSGINI